MNQKSTPGNLLSRLWSFFTSVKLTVVILLCLAVTSVIGTVIIQNQPPSFYIKVYGAFLYNLFSVLDIFDMYRSWWFRLLMAGLCLNIVACSIHRLSAGWKVIFPKSPVLNPDRIKSGSDPVDFEVKQSPEALSDIFAPILAKGYGVLQTKKTPTGVLLLAEKNRWTRLGVYVVHLSVILLVIGGLIGSLFGFEGFVALPEGEIATHIQLKNSDLDYALPFAIRCDDFDVSFYPSGAPKEFVSRLTLIENDTEVLKKEIVVNRPLRYKGISIYQASYGEMPAHNHPVADLGSKPVVLNFTAAESGMQYTRELALGGAFELPEGQGTFTLKEFRPADTFMGKNIGETIIGVITAPGQAPKEVQLPLRFESFDRMRRGYFVFSVANTHDLLGHAEAEPRQYYTGLQVSSDPGVWVVYTGFILMIVGCYISFFMSHQQIVVEISPKKSGRSRVVLAGTANKNKTGMNLKLKQLSKVLIKKASLS